MSYPKMLYKTKEIWMIVPDEAGENEAKKDGWLNSWTDKVEAKEEPKVEIKDGIIGRIKELSPQQRAAITRKKNKAKKHA